MGAGRFSTLISIFICLIVSLISCGPKTTPQGTPPEPSPAPSITSNVYDKLPADQSDFSWMTHDRRSKRIEDVRLILEKAMKEYGARGLTVMIKQLTWKVGTDSYLLNLGKESLNPEKMIDSQTVFRADQLGLPILAYIALQFHTYKQFDIDKPIMEYLTTETLGSSLYAGLAKDPLSEKLTARMILRHQSGLPDSQKIHPGKELAFTNPPGKQFSYSIEAYALLCLVLETRFRLTINEIAKRLVFEPFHMAHSRFNDIPESERKSAPGIEKNIAFYTNAIDYTEFAWLLRQGFYSISRELRGAHMLYPSVSVRSPSILGNDDSDKQQSSPPGLAWCLGWGAYRLAGTSLGICNFMGGKEWKTEYYATIFESSNSLRKTTAVSIFIVSDNPHSLMPFVVKEILGKIETPLAWLGFE